LVLCNPNADRRPFAVNSVLFLGEGFQVGKCRGFVEHRRATAVEESRDCIFDDLATSLANPLDIFGHGELALLAKFESPLRNQVGMHRFKRSQI